jgi:hypothetical protein
MDTSPTVAPSTTAKRISRTSHTALGSQDIGVSSFPVSITLLYTQMGDLSSISHQIGRKRGPQALPVKKGKKEGRKGEKGLQ